MEKNFDLIVIGTGAAGSTAAYKCRKAGWKVAIVDSRPFGGTCALRGCDPKKVLVGAAELMDWMNRMNQKGISFQGGKIDWPALMRLKRTFTGPVPADREKGYAKAGITTFHGRAHFIDSNTIQVGADALTAQHLLIATGAIPANLEIPGEENLTTSTQFLELDQLPTRIAFVGGGYISLEFAHVATRAGAQVHLLHRGERPLKGFDPDLVDQLVAASREAGIEIRLKTAVESIEKVKGHFIVHTSGPGGREKIKVDLVVHGAGRVPEIEDLDLQKAGVRHDQRGVLTNEYLQSVSNPSIYAAGDAAASGGLPLTPVASMEGRVVASNLLEGNYRKPNYIGVPTVVFTIPPLAGVGLLEETAKARDLKFKIQHEDTSEWYSTRRVGIKYSGYKILIEEQTQRILGAHLFGPQAEEVINIFAMAIVAGLTAEDIRKLRYSYPSVASDLSYMV